MADALRGSMDAAEYKHVVLGLIFLKYISNAFEELHGGLLASLSYSHFELLVRREDPLARSFYEVECIRGNWSIRELKRQIGRLYSSVVSTDSLSARTEPAASAMALRSRTIRGPEGDVVIESRILGQFARVAPCVLAMLLFVAPGLAAGDSVEGWAALVKGGHVALIRHGNAPPGYGGDPPGFKIDDCRTQRNLDGLGRQQGRALGEAFRNHGVRVDRILSSPWCRCLETARLMAVGPVETSWALVPDMGPSVRVRLLELKAIVSAWRGPGTLVLVTHALTVRALMGFLPSQGEIAVLKPESGSQAGADLVGLIAAPE